MRLLNLLKERARQGDKYAAKIYWQIVPEVRRSRRSGIFDHSTWGTLDDMGSFAAAMFSAGPPSGRDGYLMQWASHFAREGNESALSALRHFAGHYFYAEVRLASALGVLAEKGDERAVSELRERASKGKLQAQDSLASVLNNWARNGDETAETELKTRAELGEPGSQFRYAQILGKRAQSGDEAALAALRARVHALEFGPREELLRLYRAQNPDLIVVGLDCEAGPEFASKTISQRLTRFLSLNRHA
jgi:hypothetical protein